MNDFFDRTALLIGQENLNILKNKRIAVFGLGGVGCYSVETLARLGVLDLTLIDCDVYKSTNINRQLFATSKTISMKKIDVAKNRVLEINPIAKVTTYDLFFSEDNINLIDFSNFDYVIDAIDTVSSKLAIIKTCYKLNIPVISSMGTGNKLNPYLFKVDFIENTSVCPLARVMRSKLKELNVKGVKVLYSTEKPKNCVVENNEEKGRHIPASISFVPSIAGILLAYEVVKDLISL
jgi:tRNA A37 threonylcarbamoyladenosine dehydratase